MFNKNKRKTCVAVIPAAGTSIRMKAYGNKLFADICEIPVIVRTLLAFQQSPWIDAIIIPTQSELVSEIENICREHQISKLIAAIPGGATRAESVLNGVCFAENKFDLIAVHDAARPFVSQSIISLTVNAATLYSAAAPAVPVKDTIKTAVGKVVTETLPREKLFAIQTPQIFDTDLLSAALKKAVDENLPITDDCSAVEAVGMRVFLTDGDYFNIKITTPEDLILAEAIAKHISENEVKSKCE